MSKSKYKVYNGKSLGKLFENSRLYFLVIMLISGLIAGSVLLKNKNEIVNEISILFNTYHSIKNEQGIFHNFCNSFAVNGAFIIANIFGGFSLIGYPFLTILPILKGLGIGSICGYLYSVHKFAGLGYSILMIYPGAIVSSFAFILACNNSCEYSKNAYQKAIKGRGRYEKEETRVYLTRQLVFLGICAASSLIDAILNEIFSGFFKI